MRTTPNALLAIVPLAVMLAGCDEEAAPPAATPAAPEPAPPPPRT